MSLGYDGDDGCFHIDGVTGPDEYTALVDDNTYTNLMAAQNLRAAAAAVAALAGRVTTSSRATSRTRGCGPPRRMAVPYNERLRVHEQSRGFTTHEKWDFERSARDEEYPLLLHAPYFDLYRRQVIKQADLVLALHWAGDAFTAEEKARAFAYYEPLTVRDSSLSACTQAVLAAEVGPPRPGRRLSGRGRPDGPARSRAQREGRSAHRVPGRWVARTRGRLRGHARHATSASLFRPQLPPGWQRLHFSVRPRGQRLHVDITPERVEYSVDGDEAVEITHCSGGRTAEITVRPGKPVTRNWRPVRPLTPAPSPPPGREPRSLAFDQPDSARDTGSGGGGRTRATKNGGTRNGATTERATKKGEP